MGNCGSCSIGPVPRRRMRRGRSFKHLTTPHGPTSSLETDRTDTTTGGLTSRASRRSSGNASIIRKAGGKPLKRPHPNSAPMPQPPPPHPPVVLKTVEPTGGYLLPPNVRGWTAAVAAVSECPTEVYERSTYISTDPSVASLSENTKKHEEQESSSDDGTSCTTFSSSISLNTEITCPQSRDAISLARADQCSGCLTPTTAHLASPGRMEAMSDDDESELDFLEMYNVVYPVATKDEPRRMGSPNEPFLEGGKKPEPAKGLYKEVPRKPDATKKRDEEAEKAAAKKREEEVARRRKEEAEKAAAKRREWEALVAKHEEEAARKREEEEAKKRMEADAKRREWGALVSRDAAKNCEEEANESEMLPDGASDGMGSVYSI